MTEQETVEIVADRVVRETDKAAMFDFDGLEVWLPKSQLIDLDIMDDGTASMRMPAWLAKAKGLA